MKELIHELKVYEDLIANYCKPNNLKDYCSRWLRKKPFGNMDWMRAELEYKYGGEQFWVKSFDGAQIDCMIVPAVNNNSIH